MKYFTLDDIQQLIDDPYVYESTGDIWLDKRFREPNNRQPYYRFFYYLARELHPNFVVELGGYQGTAAAHFAAGCLGEGATVVTIDHHTDPGDELNKAKMLEAEKQYSNLHYIRGWTNDKLAQREKGNHALGDAPDAMPKLLRLMPKLSLPMMIEGGNGIDILFIDSWHQYEEARMDWQAYGPLLSSPSLIICDDIIGGHGPAIGGMLDFWEELPGEKFLNDTLHPGYPMGFLKYETS